MVCILALGVTRGEVAVDSGKEEDKTQDKRSLESGYSSGYGLADGG